MNTKQNVISRLCALASEVGEEMFHHECAHDCFCGQNNMQEESFRFSDAVLSWIEDVVRAKIERVKNGEEMQ